jgi:predicted MPP superfamily phosphohydrolase
MKIISSTGVTLLNNSFLHFGKLCIGGLSSSGVTAYAEFRKDKQHPYPDWKHFNSPQRNEPYTDWLSDFEAQSGFKILLCHHPEYWTKYLKGRKIDLVLSGHAHGGQIRIFGQGLFAPGQGILPKYTSGIHGNMIISRGLANTGKPIPRLFNRREIVYIFE